METYISISFGVESSTLAILHGGRAKGIWADPGSEHAYMYERVDKMEKYVQEIHPNFEIIRVKGTVTHKGEQYDNLEELAIAYKFMPSGQARYCTKYFKIEPIDKYLATRGECELMIGLNADEENSREGNWGLNPNVKYTYPLIEDGLTRADCEEILYSKGLHPNFPPYMLRGGCRMCFFKTEKEYRAMYHLAKEEFMEVLEFEKLIQDKKQKFFSILSNGKSMSQVKAECETELFPDVKSLYDDYKKQGTSCGAFCHR